MITIVIPTLWRSPDTLNQTIKSFKDTLSEYPDNELILIDNLNSDFEDSDINVIKPKENIGVNPAWNIGAAMAYNEHILFMNDDLTVNFKPVLKCLSEGLPGLDYGTIAGDREFLTTEGISVNEDADTIEITRDHSGRFFGFGCFFIVKRDMYDYIPRVFKYFWGDDWLFYILEHLRQRKSYFLKNLKLPGRIAVTSNDIDHENNHIENDWWTPYTGAMHDFYKKLNSRLFRGELIDDKDGHQH